MPYKPNLWPRRKRNVSCAQPRIKLPAVKAKAAITAAWPAAGTGLYLVPATARPVAYAAISYRIIPPCDRSSSRRSVQRGAFMGSHEDGEPYPPKQSR